MIKIKQGWIENNEGVRKDIVVKSAAPNKLRDILIGSAIVGLGISYLTFTAFKNGAQCYEDAELALFEDLHITERC